MTLKDRIDKVFPTFDQLEVNERNESYLDSLWLGWSQMALNLPAQVTPLLWSAVKTTLQGAWMMLQVWAMCVFAVLAFTGGLPLMGMLGRVSRRREGWHGGKPVFDPPAN